MSKNAQKRQKETDIFFLARRRVSKCEKSSSVRESDVIQGAM
jgi:hypothetical protein